MTLSHTILAFLLDSPYTGYELSKHFDSEAVGCFWKASHQQIYRELSRMAKINWVEYELIEQQGKPNKKVFSITEKGREEFQNWFTEPCLPTSIREDLLVKVLAGSHISTEALIEQIQTRLAMHQAQLASYQEREHEVTETEESTVGPNFVYFTLRRGILYEREWINWCEEVLAELKATPLPKTVVQSSKHHRKCSRKR